MMRTSYSERCQPLSDTKPPDRSEIWRTCFVVGMPIFKRKTPPSTELFFNTLKPTKEADKPSKHLNSVALKLTWHLLGGFLQKEIHPVTLTSAMFEISMGGSLPPEPVVKKKRKRCKKMATEITKTKLTPRKTLENDNCL